MSEAQHLIFRCKNLDHFESSPARPVAPLKTRHWVDWPKTAQEGCKDLNVLSSGCQLKSLHLLEVSKSFPNY